MADGNADFIFRTNIEDVAEEIKSGLKSISQASNIPQTKAGKNLLSGLSQDVEKETMRLAQQVRAYKEQLDEIERSSTKSLGKRQSLAQYSNDQLDQARGAFRTAALNRARGSGIPTADVASLVTEMEKAFLSRAANEIRGRARVAAGTSSAKYAGQASDIRDNADTRDIRRRYTRALEDDARNAERSARAGQQTADAAERTAVATTAGAHSAEQGAKALAENAHALQELAEVNKQNARRAQQEASRPAPATPPAAAPPAAASLRQPAQQTPAPTRPTGDVVDPRTGLLREPTEPYRGPWRERTYQTSKVGQAETHHILEMAQSEGVDPGFKLTQNGIRVHDPNRARYELDGAYQAALDNVSDALSPEDKKLYTQRRDSLRKLMDAIGAHRDALVEDMPSAAALADPAATQRRQAAGGAGGGSKPPTPPAPPEPPEEPEEPAPRRKTAAKVIRGGDTDDEAKAERERLENALALRVSDPNDPLRKINKSTAFDPTEGIFYRRKLSAANPEPELTRVVEMQHAQEDLAALYESDHAKALRAEQTRQQRAFAQEITQARRANPDQIVRITGTGGVRTGIEADLRDRDNPRYFERVNAKRLRELDPQNPDDVLKLDESTRNLARMRAEAAKTTSTQIAQAEKDARAEDAARTQRRNALNLEAARQAAPDQFVDVKGTRGVVADLRNDPNSPDYYAPVRKSGGIRRLDPNNDADQIRISDVQGRLAKQQTAELQGVLRGMDTASKSATKELDAVEERRSKKRQKDIDDQIKAEDKAAARRSVELERAHAAALNEDSARTKRAQRDFGKDYDAAHAENTVRDQRELYRDLIAARNTAPKEQFRDLPGGVTAYLDNPANPQFFQKAGRDQVRHLDPSQDGDQARIDEARRNLALQEQAQLDRKRTSDERMAAKQEAAAGRLDQHQSADYQRQQRREAADQARQAKQDALDAQRQQRAGLEGRLLQGDKTISDVPRRGGFAGGYIDRSDPDNRVVTERAARGGLTALDPRNPVDQTKIAQALASEAEASSRAAEATLRRARAEERSEAALDKQVANFGGGGIGSGFVRGFTSGGFGGSGEASSLESLARSAGTATKYTAIYRALGLMTTAAGQAVQQLLDMDDSITELQVAMGSASNVSGDFTNSLQDIAAQGGFNVGEAMDVAASGIRAFKDATDGSQQSVDALGEGFARQAQRIAVLSKTDLTDAAGNLKAAVSGFDLNPNEANFRRITDAIAGGKLAGGGDEKDLSQFMASAAVSFKQAGFNPEETASIGSKVISSLDESGTLAATRLSRLFSILQGSSGKTYLSQLNEQIGSLNQTRGKNDQISRIDINASASQQVLELADAYSKLSKQEQQVLLNRVGGTGQSRELQVLLETVRKQTQDASGGFDNKGVEEYQKRLDNIRARLNQIKGDIKGIVTNLASSGLFIPFEAALPIIQTMVRMMRELTQSIRFLEQIPGFQWVEQIALAGVAIRALLPAMRTLREGGVRGALGLAEARIAPGRALSRQRLQEAQEASEVGGTLGARRVAGGGRLDVAVQETSAGVRRLARVTGLAQDKLLDARDARAGKVAKLSAIPVTDARYAEMEREIAALDATIARRTERLHRLRERLGAERDQLEEAGGRQALGTKVNQRYDGSEEALARRRDQELANIDAQQARDQRRRQRLGIDAATASPVDYEAQREATRQQHAAELARLNARRTAELDDVANRDLKAPSLGQRVGQRVRNVGENLADRGVLATGLQATSGVGTAARGAVDALKGLPGAARGLKDDFQRLRTEGVSPLSATLRSLPGGNSAANALGRLNGRDELGNAPLGGTRSQRFRGGVANMLSSNLGWFGGGLIAADAAMQIHDAYGNIQDAQKAGNDAAGIDLVGRSASALLDSSKGLNAAASNLEEATGGFSGFWADKIFNSDAGTAQANSLRGQSAYEQGEGNRLKSLQDRHAQSGISGDYASALDQTSAQGLADSMQALQDAGVPATERVKALATSIDRLNAVAAGTTGKFNDVERERQRADAGNAAIQSLQGLQGQNPTAKGWESVKSRVGSWLDDVRGSFGEAPVWNVKNQAAMDLSNVDTQQVGEDATWATMQMQNKGIDLTKDAGLKKYQQLLQAKLTQSGLQGPGQAKAVADAVARSLGQNVGNLDSFDDPYAQGVANAQQTVQQGQAMRQEVATADQLKALQSGKQDTGVHASEALLDYFKAQRKRIETMLANSRLTDEQANVILGIIDQGEQQAKIDEIQEQRQQAQIGIQTRARRRQHDLQNTANPNAIDAIRSRDNQTDLSAALNTGDTDAAAQLMSVMPPDQIDAARKALQKKIDDERKKFTDQHKDFIGPLNPDAQDPHLAHLLHEQSVFTDAFGQSAPQYTKGDIAAAQQTAEAARSGSQAAADAANVAAAQQNVLDAQRQYGQGSKEYWDATGQLNAAKRQQATDELENAITDRNILIDSSSRLDQANAAIRDANDRRRAALGRGDKDEAERQRLLGLKAEEDRKSAQLELDFLNKRKRIDITNPALLAQQEAGEAQRRADAARQDPHTGADHQAQLDADARQARLNAEKTAHDQWLSNLQEKDKLGDISHQAYIASLQADIKRLKAIKHLTYQQQQELYADRDALEQARNQLTGQFNLGNISLPSVYEVRRSILAQAQAGTAGAPGTSTAVVQSAGSTRTTTAADTTKTVAAGVANNTTNNVTVNGADFAKVVHYLNQVFGKTARVATTPRKA